MSKQLTETHVYLPNRVKLLYLITKRFISLNESQQFHVGIKLEDLTTEDNYLKPETIQDLVLYGIFKRHDYIKTWHIIDELFK